MAKFTTSKFPSLIVKFDSRTRVKFERGEVEVSGNEAKALADFAERHPAYGIEQVEADEKPLTPKQRAVAKAESLGLDTSGSQKDIEERIAAHESTEEDPDVDENDAEDDADADEADDENSEDDSDEDTSDDA